MPGKPSSPNTEARRRKAVRFTEIAALAGVSEATVDRVLNERGSVAFTTTQKVLSAARALQLPRVLPHAWKSACNIEVFLPHNPMPFWADVADAIKTTARLLPHGVTIHRSYFAECDQASVREALLHPRFPRQGVVIAAEESDGVRDALTQIIRRGEAVAVFATEMDGLPPHIFSGIDNLAAGRTAGLLMARMLPKPSRILLLQGNDWLYGHRRRVAGFLEVLAEMQPGHEIVLRLTKEAGRTTRRALSDTLAGGPIDGLYDTGHAASFIADMVRALPRRPIWIGHEADAAHRALLREGLIELVLDQDPKVQVRSAIMHVLRQIDAQNAEPELARPELRLFCKYNI